MNIGILGGTFDPIHKGHIIIAEYCKKKLNLNYVLFIPSGNPPHKKPITKYKDRVEMVKLAIKNYVHFKLVELEKNHVNDNYNYTYYTLKKAQQIYPNSSILFIIGKDNVEEIKTWFNYKKLFDLAQFVVISRNHNNNSNFKNLDYYDKLKFLDMPEVDISSSKVRDHLLHNKSVKNMLVKDVENYIKKNNLYMKEVS